MGRSFQCVETTGKRGSEDARPRREATDPHVIRFHRNSPKFGDAGDIDHRRRNRPLSQRRIEIRSPRQDLPTVGSEIVDRLVQRPRPEIQASDPLGCRPNRRRMKGLPSIVIRSRLACTEWSDWQNGCFWRRRWSLAFLSFAKQKVRDGRRSGKWQPTLSFQYSIYKLLYFGCPER